MHNTLVIQVGFTIVLLLIAVYVYRIFTGSATSSGTSLAGGDFSSVEKKLNQLIEQQKSRGQVAGATQSEQTVDENSTSAEEVDRLKSEIYNLRQQLNESEKKVFDMKEGASAEPATGASTNVSERSAEDLVKIEELNKEVSLLKTKLSDYEIIAEDISDLSDLRKENEELRKKIEKLGGVAEEGSEGQPAATEPAAEGASEAAQKSSSDSTAEPSEPKGNS